MTEAAYVASPPAKPLMVYDGGCNFCKSWVGRWQRVTEGRVDYVASQKPEVAVRFPEIPWEQFEAAVQFIETDGKVYRGAAAVFRSLVYSRYWKWLDWFYRKVPGFAPVTEKGYSFVARRRSCKP